MFVNPQCTQLRHHRILLVMISGWGWGVGGRVLSVGEEAGGGVGGTGEGKRRRR